MDEQAYDEPASGQIQKNRFETSIELNSVGYSIDSKQILSDVTVNFNSGLCHLVIGPSGAGKSSMLALLAKFAAPQNGSIEVDGLELASLDSNRWRKCLGIISQDSILINASIRQNLLYAKPDASDDEMIQVLKIVKLDRLDNSLEKVLDRQVGNRGEFLSGGERQRFSIARALLTDPDLLLIDEPTASLDEENSLAIVDLLKELKKNRTMIIVSHDALLKTIADTEIELDNGRVNRISDHTDAKPNR